MRTSGQGGRAAAVGDAAVEEVLPAALPCFTKTAAAAAAAAAAAGPRCSPQGQGSQVHHRAAPALAGEARGSVVREARGAV
jgi:hypothetical protein